MATIDATKGQVSYAGENFLLSYALRCAKEDFLHLLDEIKKFDPKNSYPNHEPRVAYQLEFGKKLYRQTVLIVLVASAMIEALANLLLSENADSDTFAILERATPIEKWVTLPKIFISNYELPKDKELYNQLRLLNVRRNSITHSKPEIKIDDKIIHRGNMPKRGNKENALHLAFCDLPEKLIDNLGKYDQHQAVKLKIFFSMMFNKDAS